MATPASDRVKVRRGPHKGRYDRATIHRILDRALVGHIAFVDRGAPFCIPMLVARVDEAVYVHGSRASRMLRALATGAPACVAVTVLDGLVLARSIFEHSANYESVVAVGRFRPVDGDAERLAALEAFTEKLLPGRWAEVRPPSTRELKATTVLAMTLDEAAAKCRTGPPDDDDSADAALEVWAGVIPLVTSYGTPVPSPGLRAETPLPAIFR
jgi:nitroimidazol reductase NimA-like FMN-containing flavoprotein (pyridoxamine 5'-phosphate oxidase superfamily)